MIDTAETHVALLSTGTTEAASTAETTTAATAAGRGALTGDVADTAAGLRNQQSYSGKAGSGDWLT